jgi:hypothetical protein
MMHNNLKRSGKVLFKIAIATLILLLLSQSINALGIAPSRKVVDYSTELQSYTARIINNDNKDMKVMLYPQGELADYVKLSQNTFTIKASESEKEFSYTLQLPAGLEPGTKNLSIIIIEVPLDLNVPENSQTTIISTVSVAHQLRINVPYPGLFAEGILYSSEGNTGDTITFTTNVINKGSENIVSVTGEVVIKGPTNEEIARIPSSKLDSIAAKNSGKIAANWKADVNPGLYYAEFIVNYAERQFVLRKSFMVGNYDVEIRSLKVNNFRLGTIAKFDVELLSRWNQPISNVYAELQVVDDKGSILSTFKTNPIDLTQLTTSIITGYWDTADATIGNYDVRVVAHYGDKSSERLFRTVVGIDSIQVQGMEGIANVVAASGQGNSLSLVYILVIVSILFNIGLFIYFKFMRKKEQ